MIKKYFNIFLITCAIAAIVVFSKNTMSAASNALETCLNVLLPSLFPFFVLSRLFILSGGASMLNKVLSPVVKRLFGISGNGAAPFILGIISGYPVGAQSVCELYENKLISKSEAENLLCFCNNSGPLFVMGAVGIGMFNSRDIGILLYITHVISAVTVGIILKKITVISHINTPVGKQSGTKDKNIFTQSVEKSVATTLNVFGYVIFFAVVMDILNSLGAGAMLSSALRFLNIPSDVINSCFFSVIEITTGVKKLSECSDYPLSILLVFCAAAIGWGGISVHMQVKGIISKTNLSFKKYLFGKLLHSAVSSVFAGIFFTLFPKAAETFAPEAEIRADTVGTEPFFIIISFLIILAYMVKILSVKPPNRCGKYGSKNRPQSINSK